MTSQTSSANAAAQPGLTIEIPYYEARCDPLAPIVPVLRQGFDCLGPRAPLALIWRAQSVPDARMADAVFATPAQNGIEKIPFPDLTAEQITHLGPAIALLDRQVKKAKFKTPASRRPAGAKIPWRQPRVCYLLRDGIIAQFADIPFLTGIPAEIENNFRGGKTFAAAFYEPQASNHIRRRFEPLAEALLRGLIVAHSKNLDTNRGSNLHVSLY